jgi:hypothetical protein
MCEKIYKKYPEIIQKKEELGKKKTSHIDFCYI